MSKFLCITVRFLQPLAHGRDGRSEPEWPPSPLRLFQAMVAAAAARWNERTRLEYAVPALGWLARQCPKTGPAIVSAHGAKSEVKYRLYIPDNVGDKEDKRIEKDVRPTHLSTKNGEFAAVHYLYPVADVAEFAKHKQTLTDAARSITHLGWGVDMVAGDASEMPEEKVAALIGIGERWQPTKDASGTQLRVPRAGTLKALMDKHEAFLNRLPAGGFKPVPPLTAFDTVGYRRDTDSAPRPWVAFRISSIDPDAPNPSFGTTRHTRDVAAWVRHATGQACAGWPFGDPASFVHGHVSSTDSQPLRGEGADNRFMYLPLPSIERRGERGEYVGAIRRVLLTAPPGFEDRIDWLRRRLPGHELAWGTDVNGLLNTLPDSDWVLGRYTGPAQGAKIWSTVTPVVLPGYDDPDGIRRRLKEKDPAKTMTASEKNNQVEALARRTRGLLEKAFRHAGLSEELVAGIADLSWRNIGFRAGVDPASSYTLPDRLTGARYHVRVQFAHPVRGPLAVGAGRYRGLGLFAADSNGTRNRGGLSAAAEDPTA